MDSAAHINENAGEIESCPQFFEEKLGDWESLKSVLFALSSGEGRWIFRGQRKSGWRLEPTLERLANEHRGEAYCSLSNLEKYLLFQFDRRMHHYLDRRSVPATLVEKLALMQHYGAPTRFLDFTKSPWVAAFFAFERAEPEIECSVWAVNRDWCQAMAVERLLPNKGKGEKLMAATAIEDPEECVEILACALREEKEAALIIEPFKMNQRLIPQQGLFLCGTHNTKRLQDILASYPKESVRDPVQKLVIDASYRREAMQDLYRMNINRATLFPGLDGFAQSLTHELLSEPWHLARLFGKQIIMDAMQARNPCG
jgi:hypothetical protein